MNQMKTEIKQSISKDGKWFITKTIMTDIKSINYFNAMIKTSQANKAL